MQIDNKAGLVFTNACFLMIIHLLTFVMSFFDCILYKNRAVVVVVVAVFSFESVAKKKM
jgi:hypothetical protein